MKTNIQIIQNSPKKSPCGSFWGNKGANQLATKKQIKRDQEVLVVVSKGRENRLA